VYLHNFFLGPPVTVLKISNAELVRQLNAEIGMLEKKFTQAVKTHPTLIKEKEPLCYRVP